LRNHRALLREIQGAFAGDVGFFCGRAFRTKKRKPRHIVAPLCSALFPKRALYLPQKNPVSLAKGRRRGSLAASRSLAASTRIEMRDSTVLCRRNTSFWREVQGSFGEKSAAQRKGSLFTCCPLAALRTRIIV